MVEKYSDGVSSERFIAMIMVERDASNDGGGNGDIGDVKESECDDVENDDNAGDHDYPDNFKSLMIRNKIFIWLNDNNTSGDDKPYTSDK